MKLYREEEDRLPVIGRFSASTPVGVTPPAVDAGPTAPAAPVGPAKPVAPASPVAVATLPPHHLQPHLRPTLVKFQGETRRVGLAPNIYPYRH